MTDLNAAFAKAVESEKEVRQSTAAQAQTVDGLPDQASVELAEPDRIQRTWRGILATALIAAAIAVLVVQFFDIDGAKEVTNNGITYSFFFGSLLAGLILAIGWGTAKVTWGGKEVEDDDDTTD